MQSSDHFYYMATKWLSDGDVHKYFNPYESSYDSFINYMNVLSDFKMEVDKQLALQEKEGNLGKFFDMCLENDKFGEKSFEKAECKMFKTAIDGVLKKSETPPSDIDTVLGGDLLNQIVSASFAMREYDSSFLGLYNACGTFAESLLEGKKPPIDVYDTATWMAITCLSEQSAAMGSVPVPVPDFTSGMWIDREPYDKGMFCLNEICGE